MKSFNLLCQISSFPRLILARRNVRPVDFVVVRETTEHCGQPIDIDGFMMSPLEELSPK